MNSGEDPVKEFADNACRVDPPIFKVDFGPVCRDDSLYVVTDYLQPPSPLGATTLHIYGSSFAKFASLSTPLSVILLTVSAI